MAVTWTQDLATGIRELDEQHRDLFANVASLRDSMRLGDARQATRTIAFLERYVRDHFATEERWMKATSYPGLEVHREAHEAFVRAFAERREWFDQRGPTASLVLDLSDWLGAWLHDHVRGLDRVMGKHLREHVAASGTPTPAVPSSGSR